VHQGNGTQDIAWDEAGFLYVSSHQSPCYPGTGAESERGAHGNVVNLPLPPGTGGVAFRRAWEREGVPAIAAFRPGLVLLSAGFDAHRADPLASLELEAADFAAITDALVAAAESGGGRVVSVLEGGYDLTALAASAAAHVRRLLA
jgi:acetoin utilization deacetylase AcuC-like enzyme